MQACQLAPKDTTVLENMSAVKFELGNYADAALIGQKALSILVSRPQPNTDLDQELPLLCRLTNAYIYRKDWWKANNATVRLTDGTQKISLNRSLSSLLDVYHWYPSETELWNQVFSRVPRYKPTL